LRFPERAALDSAFARGRLALQRPSGRQDQPSPASALPIFATPRATACTTVVQAERAQRARASACLDDGGDLVAASSTSPRGCAAHPGPSRPLLPPSQPQPCPCALDPGSRAGCASCWVSGLGRLRGSLSNTNLFQGASSRAPPSAPRGHRDGCPGTLPGVAHRPGDQGDPGEGSLSASLAVPNRATDRERRESNPARTEPALTGVKPVANRRAFHSSSISSQRARRDDSCE